MRRYSMICALIAALIVMFSQTVFSQDTPEQVPQSPEAQEPVGEPAETPAAEPEGPAEANETAIYGEVQDVNLTANSLSVQYYDYDSDEEKTIEIALTNDTKLENAALLNDIKKGDWVDVTYTVKDGKNMASSIMVEKEEMIPEEAASEDIPQEPSQEE